jgi:hypothetical protein
VCGLKWSFDERMLASGGNDNKLYVWAPQLGGAGNNRARSRMSSTSIDANPLCKFSDHCAAVKVFIYIYICIPLYIIYEFKNVFFKWRIAFGYCRVILS